MPPSVHENPKPFWPPWMISGALHGEMVDLYVQTQLASTLHKGDVITLDNPSSHKSHKAAEMMRGIGAWSQVLPPYLPDLTPNRNGLRKDKGLPRHAYRASWL